MNGQGAIVSGALTLKATEIGGPTETVVLNGYTMAGLNNGRRQISFTTTTAGNDYRNIGVLR